MDMHLIRREDGYRPDGIFSHLIADVVQEKEIAVTLEHAYPANSADVAECAAVCMSSDKGLMDYLPKIPPGVYTCVRGTHSLDGVHQFETFEITGIPNHSKVLFHRGNYNEDSAGCVLLGDAILPASATARHEELISNTPAAFARFIALQAGCDSFQLTVAA
jgi:Family of unknown function (DUF5675)